MSLIKNVIELDTFHPDKKRVLLIAVDLETGRILQEVSFVNSAIKDGKKDIVEKSCQLLGNGIISKFK